MMIAGLARAGGVGVETIRYYQRRGLMTEPERDGGGGARRYTDGDVRRLRFIRAAQTAGFSLEEIGKLLALDAGEDRATAHALATERLARLDARIAELQAARTWLSRLAADCAGGGAGPCPIIRAFAEEAPPPA